jgi:hypothetical protein
MGTKLSRSVAQDLANRLNGALNRTVSDSRLSVESIVGEWMGSLGSAARILHRFAPPTARGKAKQ